LRFVRKPESKLGIRMGETFDLLVDMLGKFITT